MNNNMTDREKAIAAEFEKGWSAEQLDAAEFSWGPGLIDFLPHALSKKLSARAHAEGVSELTIISTAISTYLANENAA